MRLTIIFLIAGCLQVSAKGYGQKITISGKDLPLEKVFSMVRNQTGYVFFYDYAIFQNAKTVSLDIRQGNIEDVLNACFKGQGLEYKIENKTISITKKNEVPVVSQQPLPPQDDHDLVGMVKNESGSPLAGATITILKLKKIGISNERGEFIFQKIPNGSYKVEISFIGYEKSMTEIVVSNNSAKIEVSLKQASAGLDQAIVIPYGTTTQRLNTGDVTTVMAKEIQEQPVGNVLGALEGRVPGLIINQNTGLPGGGFAVQIRGQNSILNGNDPFYVVDGVPYSSEIPNATGSSLINSALRGGNPLNYINPYDIESVEILKDADATAIYGSRAANGAILITTKKGKAGATRIDINVNSGVTSLARDIQLLNTSQYLAMRHEAFKNDGKTPLKTKDYDLTFWDTTRYTNWSKVFLNNHPVYTDAEVSISGGNTLTQWLVGGGFNRQTSGMPTLTPGDGKDQRGSMHFNITNSSQDKRFKLDVTGSYASDKNNIQSEDLSIDRFKYAPDSPPLFNSDGSLNWAPLSPGLVGTWSNPYAILNEKYNGVTSNLVGNAIISYALLPGLEIKTSLGYTNTQTDESQIKPTTITDPGRHNTSGSSNFNESNTHSWIIEPQATYKLQLGRGILTTLVGGSFHENNARAQFLGASGFVNDALLANPASASSEFTENSSSQYKYQAVFARLNYNWQDKYLLNLTARRDGSSRFGPGKQFGDFGALGAGWIFSRENFIQNTLPWLSYGKLRGSYGSTGNDQIGDYQFLDLYTTTYLPYGSTQGLYPESLFNPDLAWEIDKKLEGGIELGFLRDRITIQASFYRNRSGNQLVSIPVSMVTGFTSLPSNLPALVQNAGQEFVFHSINIETKDFTWASTLNLSISRNKLIFFPGLSSSPYANLYIVGKPISILHVYHMIGVNDSAGIYQFSDFKGNPTFNPNSNTDMNTIIDLTPSYYGGFLNSFSYKGFSIDALFQFVKQKGKDIFGSYSQLSGVLANVPVAYFNRWQKPGDYAIYQQFSQNHGGSAANALNYAAQSDFAYSDASFIRLKNLSVSWQLPHIWKEKIRVQNLRVYVNAQNLLTITKYNGIDPESQSMNSPPKRVWTAGFQMTF